MAVPASDLETIREFCAQQVPPEMQHQMRVEHRVRGHTVTIVESRPPWGLDPGPEWTEMPQARMKYDAAAGWTLYWFDRNSAAHRYDLLDPGQSILRVLAEYDADPTGIFKG